MAAQADTRQESCYAMAIDCVGLVLNAASGKRCTKILLGTVTFSTSVLLQSSVGALVAVVVWHTCGSYLQFYLSHTDY